MLNREELAEHACLRCTGRLFVEHLPAPYAADEWTCLQCGYTRDVEAIAPLPLLNRRRQSSHGKMPL